MCSLSGLLTFSWIKKVAAGFPGGAVVENLPADARKMLKMFKPWSGRIPHAAEQLGP